MTGARGEGTIILPGGGECVVLFTNRALADAEKVLGKSILAVAQGFGQGDMGVGDVAQLLLVGMRAARNDARAGGPVPTITDAYAAMDQAGFGKVSASVIEAIAAVLSYGQDGDQEDGPNV